MNTISIVKLLNNCIFALHFVNGTVCVAQLDRAPDYGSGGLGFESLRERTLSWVLSVLHLKPICI